MLRGTFTLPILTNRKNPDFQPPRYTRYFNRIAPPMSQDAPPASSAAAGLSSLVSPSNPSGSSPTVIVPPILSAEPASASAANFAIELSTPEDPCNINLVSSPTVNLAPGDVDVHPRNSREPESGSSSPSSSYPICAQKRNSRSPESNNDPLGPIRPLTETQLNNVSPVSGDNLHAQDSRALLPVRRIDNVSSPVVHLSDAMQDSRALLPEQRSSSPVGD